MDNRTLVAVGVAVVFAIGCFVGANFPRSRPTTDLRLEGSWRALSDPQVKLIFDGDGTFFIVKKGVPIQGARRWYADGNIGYFEGVGEEGERQMQESPFKVKDGKLWFESFSGVGGSHDYVRVDD